MKLDTDGASAPRVAHQGCGTYFPCIPFLDLFFLFFFILAHSLASVKLQAGDLLYKSLYDNILVVASTSETPAYSQNRIYICKNCLHRV